MEHVTSPDGATIGWSTSGTGSPLLLVHGTTADHTRWAEVTPAFADRFTVHAMDRRGRGLSTDGGVYGVQREAEDVAAVADAIGGPVDVLAHSYGAVCALEAALLSGAISRSVLYEPPIPTGLPMYPPGLPSRMEKLIDAGKLESALELFFREVVRMPEDELAVYRTLPAWETRVRLAPTIPRELAIDQRYHFDEARFVDFDRPVQLQMGGDSPPLFQEAIERLHHALPDASVVVFPGQQHIAMDLAPEMFVAEVREFLTE